MNAPVQTIAPLTEVVDDAVDAYVRWREECDDAREAYLRWSCAAKADRTLASYAYIAALDREEIAASVYAVAMRRLGQEFVEGPFAEPRRLWRGNSASARAMNERGE